jgi:hypothetical protein
MVDGALTFGPYTGRHDNNISMGEQLNDICFSCLE